MVIFFRSLSTFLLMTLLSSCFLLGPGYNIDKDPIAIDLEAEIKTLEEERNQLVEETASIERELGNVELDEEIRESMRKEVFEAIHWKNKMFEHIAYRKIRLKNRQALLSERKKSKLPYKEKAIKEVEEYFLHKKLNPIHRGWEDRFRAAVDI